MQASSISDASKWIWMILAVLVSSGSLIVGNKYADFIEKAVIGPTELDKVSAAQFPEK